MLDTSEARNRIVRILPMEKSHLRLNSGEKGYYFVEFGKHE